MMNFLCAANAQPGQIIIYVVLILILVAMLILPYFTQKKKNAEFLKMIDSIKVGDLVRTAGGIIGKVTKITDKGEIKTVTLETGSKTEKSYIEFDMSMIYCVLKSTKPVETESDKPAEVETKEAEATETKTENKEEKVEETKAAETVEEKEEKPAKKAAKKTSTKKSK